ncbi:MAG: hypothetical protein LBJ14_05785 [Desulfarculales bacterium]|nr:hypothetical protein [Desulfarculales bacterium]
MIRNCLTCRWEPNWQPFAQSSYLIGECRKPMPLHSLAPLLRLRQGEVSSFSAILPFSDNNCPAWEIQQ